MRPQPDDLTSREREVLALIRLGLTNEEIAQRLDISLAGAKYHVSQILSKLGVATREDAAAVVLAERRRWWAAWALVARLAAAATVVATAAGIAVLVWGATRTGGPGEDTAVVAAGTPIPWVDATPAPTLGPAPLPTANPVDLAVRPCDAGDLEPLLIHIGAAAGRSIITTDFANLSSSACRLQGIPDLVLLDEAGAAIALAADSSDRCFPGGPDACRADLPVVLWPGPVRTPGSEVVPSPEPAPVQAALTLLLGSGGCQQDAPHATIARITLSEGGGSLDIPLTGEALTGLQVCYLGLTQFKRSGFPEPTPEPQTVTASLQLPASAVRGHPFEFVVLLTNSGAAPLTFEDPCPNYITFMGGRKEVWANHALNCVPAGTLVPGDAVKFQIIVDLPADTPLGRQPIVWSLDRWGPGTSADAEIEIVDR